MVLELKAGIRLPTPYNCPKPIANLIQHCFQEQPSDRPSFGEIKESVSVSYKEVTRFFAENKLNATKEHEEVHYADLGLEERYLDMRTQNQNFKELHKPGVNDNKLIKFDKRKSNIPFQNDELMYASLQNMSTGVAEPTPVDGMPSYMLLDGPNYPMDKTNIKNGHLRNVLGVGYKRFFSYSDIECPLTCHATYEYHEQKNCQGLTSAKSYPNPYYMMNLANIEVHNSSEEYLKMENIKKEG